MIAGGTGLIGRHLSDRLIKIGYNVAILSRSENCKSIPVQYYWNIDKHFIDPDALSDVDYIINLAGSNIGEKRWTKKRKRQILDSRIISHELIEDKLKMSKQQPKAYISASAVGYYGSQLSDRVFFEDDPPGNDFLAKVCNQWEYGADHLAKLSGRVVKIRTGIVLDKEGGVLHKMMPLFRIGFGSALGTGKQIMPWIHIEDLCNIYIKAIEDVGMRGSYNAVSPELSTNKEFSQTLAKVIKKPLWLPNVPGFLLKLIFGKMSVLLLKGNKISADKLESSGYQFKYKDLTLALTSLVK